MIGKKILNIVTSYNSLKMWIIGTVMNATKSVTKRKPENKFKALL